MVFYLLGKQFEDIAVRKANRSEFLVLLLIVDSSFVLSSLGRLSKDLCTHEVLLNAFFARPTIGSPDIVNLGTCLSLQI